MKTPSLFLALSLVLTFASQANAAQKCSWAVRPALDLINRHNESLEKVGAPLEMELINEDTIEDPVYRYRVKYFVNGQELPFADTIDFTESEKGNGCRLSGFSQGSA
jgi:hypothetical protein